MKYVYWSDYEYIIQLLNLISIKNKLQIKSNIIRIQYLKVELYSIYFKIWNKLSLSKHFCFVQAYTI